MKKLFASVIVATAMLFSVVNSHAQAVGSFTLMSGVPIVSGSTNSYTPNTYTPYGNLFIGTWEFTNVGVYMTCRTALPTNATGSVTIRLSPTWDGIVWSPNQSVVFTHPFDDSTVDLPTGTNIVCGGLMGFFVTSIEMTNLNVGGVSTAGITNYLNIGFNRLAPKYGTFDATPF